MEVQAGGHLFMLANNASLLEHELIRTSITCPNGNDAYHHCFDWGSL